MIYFLFIFRYYFVKKLISCLVPNYFGIISLTIFCSVSKSNLYTFNANVFLSFDKDDWTLDKCHIKKFFVCIHYNMSHMKEILNKQNLTNCFSLQIYLNQKSLNSPKIHDCKIGIFKNLWSWK